MRHENGTGSFIAKASTARGSAGTASGRPKLTKKGKRKLRGAERAKATVIAQALGPQGRVVLALKQKLTFK